MEWLKRNRGSNYIINCDLKASDNHFTFIFPNSIQFYSIIPLKDDGEEEARPTLTPGSQS